MKSKVVYYDSFREIGMIHEEGKYDDIFFHWKDVEGNESLTEGDRVSFSLESKGIMAGKMALRIRKIVKEEK